MWFLPHTTKIVNIFFPETRKCNYREGVRRLGQRVINLYYRDKLFSSYIGRFHRLLSCCSHSFNFWELTYFHSFSLRLLLFFSLLTVRFLLIFYAVSFSPPWDDKNKFSLL